MMNAIAKTHASHAAEGFPVVIRLNDIVLGSNLPINEGLLGAQRRTI